jgi:CRISPR-associated protein (TIGR02584 family)
VKHVLVITVGLAPQVVTETVYGLQCERGVKLDEIHMWTTRPGRRAIERRLLPAGDGMLYRCFADLGLAAPLVRVWVFGEPQDAPAGVTAAGALDDFVSREENELAADTLMRFVQLLAADPNCRIYCSLSGARKTLGPFLALALQFFGHKGDLLFHVLVSPELESDPAFFYPRCKKEEKLIRLFEVPVPLMRKRISVVEAEGETFRYSDFVRRLDEELERLERRPEVVLTRDRRVVMHEVSAQLTPLQFALYALVLERRLHCEEDCAGCERCSLTRVEIGEGLAPQLQRVLRALAVRDARLERLNRWQSPTAYDERLHAFHETVAKLNRALRATFGRHASSCEVKPVGPRHDILGYRSTLRPKDIRFDFAF